MGTQSTVGRHVPVRNNEGIIDQLVQVAFSVSGTTVYVAKQKVVTNLRLSNPQYQ